MSDLSAEGKANKGISMMLPPFPAHRNPRFHSHLSCLTLKTEFCPSTS